MQDKSNSQLEHHQKWTSWKIRYELLQIIADLILERVHTEIGDSMLLTIIDETSDVSKTEKVSICLSYVHEGIKKKFLLDFLKLNLPMQNLCLNLVLKNVVNKCFNGSSNMCSIYGGAASLIKETSPLSIYVHCYALRLNLALEGSLSLVSNLKNV